MYMVRVHGSVIRHDWQVWINLVFECVCVGGYVSVRQFVCLLSLCVGVSVCRYVQYISRSAGMSVHLSVS